MFNRQIEISWKLLCVFKSEGIVHNFNSNSTYLSKANGVKEHKVTQKDIS